MSIPFCRRESTSFLNDANFTQTMSTMHSHDLRCHQHTDFIRFALFWKFVKTLLMFYHHTDDMSPIPWRQIQWVLYVHVMDLHYCNPISWSCHKHW